MAELSKYFPANIRYEIPYDITPVVEVSIRKVLTTLGEAVILVFLVMLLFLQNIRYTLIPILMVPIALLGACAALLVAGLSINMLTLFAMVLAIGILVDDAIVVVENVERIMATEGLPPAEATRKAMNQITGAIVGITLVLMSVFVPMAFFPGSVGVIYRQFSMTMVAAIGCSALLALSLTPALCATLLKPIAHGEVHGTHRLFRWFDLPGWFNHSLDACGARPFVPSPGPRMEIRLVPSRLLDGIGEVRDDFGGVLRQIFNPNREFARCRGGIAHSHARNDRASGILPRSARRSQSGRRACQPDHAQCLHARRHSDGRCPTGGRESRAHLFILQL
jgi:hypothetical protein